MPGHQGGAAGCINNKSRVCLDPLTLLTLPDYIPAASRAPRNRAERHVQHHRSTGLGDCLRQHPIETAPVEMPSFSAAGKKEFLSENFVASPGGGRSLGPAMS